MLPEPLIRVLRAHRKTQAAERFRAGATWLAIDLVFCQENGCPVDPDGRTKAWNRFLNTASVRKARLDDACRTAETLLLVQASISAPSWR